MRKLTLDVPTATFLRCILAKSINITKKGDQRVKDAAKSSLTSLNFSTDVRTSRVIATMTFAECVLFRNLSLQFWRKPYREDTYLAAFYKGYLQILIVGVVRVNIWQSTKNLSLLENASSTGSSSINKGMFRGTSAKPQPTTSKSASAV